MDKQWLFAEGITRRDLTKLLVYLGCSVSVKAHSKTRDNYLVAVVPIRDDGGYLSIPVTISQHLVSAIVDTGSDGGLITPEAVKMLRLQKAGGGQSFVSGTGGVGRFVSNIVIPELHVGVASFGDVVFPLGGLPGLPQIKPPVVGLIGADLLSRYDVEIDISGGFLRLWRLGAAQEASLNGWLKIAQMVPIYRLGNRIAVNIALDGTRLTALVDSGARSHIVSTAAANKVGVSEDALSIDPGGVTSGVDLRQSVYHWHKFKSFSIAQEVTANPVLTVAPVTADTDMLLGADWFARNRVWISYSSNQLFFLPVAKSGED